MASTYTAQNGIEKPGTGEQSGTWGTTTNLNFDIIDRVLSGVGTITLSGTAHTLSTTDGALSDGQYKVLILGGTPSGTNTITISPNDQSKLYFVRNSSGETATFTQGSGGNVNVANGETKIIYADGAGSGAEVVDFTNTLAVPTDLVNDTTPQLGGNLDVNSNQITSASDGNVVVNPDGTGTIELEAATNITGNVEVTGNILPEADSSRDLGSDSIRFANLYVDDITTGDFVLNSVGRSYSNSVDGTQGHWRVQEGDENLYIINELTGARFKFVLEAV